MHALCGLGIAALCCPLLPSADIPPPHTTTTTHLEPHDALGTVADLGADDLWVALVLELVVEAFPGPLIRVGDCHLRYKTSTCRQGRLGDCLRPC